MNLTVPLNELIEHVGSAGKKFAKLCGNLEKEELLALLEKEEGKRSIQERKITNSGARCEAVTRIANGPKENEKIIIKGTIYGVSLVVDSNCLASYTDRSPDVRIITFQYIIPAMADLMDTHTNQSLSQAGLAQAVNHTFDRLAHRITCGMSTDLPQAHPEKNKEMIHPSE